MWTLDTTWLTIELLIYKWTGWQPEPNPHLHLICSPCEIIQTILMNRHSHEKDRTT